MENPEKDITGVIHALTQSSLSAQRDTIRTYFTPNASFTHPFCRTGSWENSRFLIQVIYRWYRVLSPHIDLSVHSVAYDPAHLLLYVSLAQTFRIRFVPFYRADVNLTTVLRLHHNHADGKYYIHSQNDLYQTDEFVKFIFPPGWLLVWLWHFVATSFCLLGAVIFGGLAWVGEGGSHSVQKGVADKTVDCLTVEELERKSMVNG